MFLSFVLTRLREAHFGGFFFGKDPLIIGEKIVHLLATIVPSSREISMTMSLLRRKLKNAEGVETIDKRRLAHFEHYVLE